MTCLYESLPLKIGDRVRLPSGKLVRVACLGRHDIVFVDAHGDRTALSRAFVRKILEQQAPCSR